MLIYASAQCDTRTKKPVVSDHQKWRHYKYMPLLKHNQCQAEPVKRRWMGIAIVRYGMVFLDLKHLVLYSWTEHQNSYLDCTHNPYSSTAARIGQSQRPRMGSWTPSPCGASEECFRFPTQTRSGNCCLGGEQHRYWWLAAVWKCRLCFFGHILRAAED